MLQLQRGASYTTFLMGVILFCFLLKIGTALWPPYFDDYMMSKQISELVSSSTKDTSISQFKSQLEQRFSMNNIYDIKMEQLGKATQTGNGIVFEKHYEVRKDFLLNIDFVITFEKKFDKTTAQN